MNAVNPVGDAGHHTGTATAAHRPRRLSAETKAAFQDHQVLRPPRCGRRGADGPHGRGGRRGLRRPLPRRQGVAVHRDPDRRPHDQPGPGEVRQPRPLPRVPLNTSSPSGSQELKSEPVTTEPTGSLGHSPSPCPSSGGNLPCRAPAEGPHRPGRLIRPRGRRAPSVSRRCSDPLLGAAAGSMPERGAPGRRGQREWGNMRRRHPLVVATGARASMTDSCSGGKFEAEVADFQPRGPAVCPVRPG